MVLFLCSEATLFGTLIGSYFYLNFGSRRWPPPPIKAPEVAGPLIATAVLVATVPLMAAAAVAARAADVGPTVRWIAVAMVIQTAYLAAQVLLIRHDLRQFTPLGQRVRLDLLHAAVRRRRPRAVGAAPRRFVLWKLVRHGLTTTG